MFDRSLDRGVLALNNGLYPVRRRADIPVLGIELACRQIFARLRTRLYSHSDVAFAARVRNAVGAESGPDAALAHESDIATQAFIAACQAFRQTHEADPDRTMILAARDMLAGRMAVVPNEHDQHRIAALAAAVASALGAKSHVIAKDETAANAFMREYSPLFRRLAISISLRPKDRSAGAAMAAYRSGVVVATFEQLAADHLVDGLARRIRSTSLQDAIDLLRCKGDRAPGAIVGGLRLCLVTDADAVLLDNAYKTFAAPAAAPDTDVSTSDSFAFAVDAIQLSISLAPDRDYIATGDGAVQLTEAGHERLSHLCADRHGFWANDERRKCIVEAALVARLGLEEHRDYRLTHPRIITLSERCNLLEKVRTNSIDPHDLLRAKHGHAPPRHESTDSLTGREIFLSYMKLGAVAPPSLLASQLIGDIYGMSAVERIETRLKRKSVGALFIPSTMTCHDVIGRRPPGAKTNRRVLFIRTFPDGESTMGAEGTSSVRQAEDKPGIVEIDVLGKKEIPDHVRANLTNGLFDAVYIDGLQLSPAVGRLIMQAADGAFHPASCRILLRAQDPTFAAAIPHSIRTLMDKIVGNWLAAQRLLGGAAIHVVRRRQRLAWRRYGQSSGEHKRLVRQRLAFMGR